MARDYFNLDIKARHASVSAWPSCTPSPALGPSLHSGVPLHHAAPLHRRPFTPRRPQPAGILLAASTHRFLSESSHPDSDAVPADSLADMAVFSRFGPARIQPRPMLSVS